TGTLLQVNIILNVDLMSPPLSWRRRAKKESPPVNLLIIPLFKVTSSSGSSRKAILEPLARANWGVGPPEFAAFSLNICTGNFKQYSPKVDSNNLTIIDLELSPSPVHIGKILSLLPPLRHDAQNLRKWCNMS